MPAKETSATNRETVLAIFREKRAQLVAIVLHEPLAALITLAIIVTMATLGNNLPHILERVTLSLI